MFSECLALEISYHFITCSEHRNMAGRDESNRGNRPHPSWTTNTTRSFGQIGREGDVNAHVSYLSSSTRRPEASSPQEHGRFDGLQSKHTEDTQSSANARHWHHGQLPIRSGPNENAFGEGRPASWMGNVTYGPRDGEYEQASQQGSRASHESEQWSGGAPLFCTPDAETSRAYQQLSIGVQRSTHQPNFPPNTGRLNDNETIHQSHPLSFGVSQQPSYPWNMLSELVPHHRSPDAETDRAYEQLLINLRRPTYQPPPPPNFDGRNDNEAIHRPHPLSFGISQQPSYQNNASSQFSPQHNNPRVVAGHENDMFISMAGNDPRPARFPERRADVVGCFHTKKRSGNFYAPRDERE